MGESTGGRPRGTHKGDRDPGSLDIMVVDDSGAPVATGEVGEICIKAPYTLVRYHDNPDATRAKFLGEWIRSGAKWTKGSGAIEKLDISPADFALLSDAKPKQLTVTF